jgi:hypothetical protein
VVQPPSLSFFLSGETKKKEANLVLSSVFFVSLRARMHMQTEVIDTVIAKECSGDGCCSEYAVVGSSRVVERAAGGLSSSRPVSVGRVLRAVLLPEGFPQSVSRDYVRYQVFDTVQAWCSTVSGIFARRALLTTFGLGGGTTTASSATSATLQWVARDLTGMCSRVAFAWARGSALDRDAKKWRLVADVCCDLSMLLVLLSPLFRPAVSLLLACAGSVLDAVVGVAGGATRAALTMHQARAGNIADVAAKDGSQETAVNIVGLLTGVALLKWLAALTPRAFLVGSWVAFCVLSFGHMLANYFAVTSVVMETLNDQRAAIIAGKVAKGEHVPTPEQVAAAEKLWWREGHVRVELGARLRKVLLTDDGDGSLSPIAKLDEESHVIRVVDGGKLVAVSLAAGISSEDIIVAAMHAHLARAMVLGGCPAHSTVDRARLFLKDIISKLRDAGWNVSRAQVTCGETRVVFNK